MATVDSTRPQADAAQTAHAPAKTLVVRDTEHLVEALMTGVIATGEAREFIEVRLGVVQDLLMSVIEHSDRQDGSVLCSAFDQLVLATAVLRAWKPDNEMQA